MLESDKVRKSVSDSEWKSLYGRETERFLELNRRVWEYMTKNEWKNTYN